MVDLHREPGHQVVKKEKRLRSGRREGTLPSISVRIVRVPWLIPGWARAQAWGRVILVKRGVQLTRDLLAHELAHVLQWRALGAGGFMWRYACHQIRRGYRENPLEISARVAEKEEFFLGWAREILRARGSER